MEMLRPDDVSDANITSSFKGPPDKLEHDPNDQGTQNPIPDDHGPTASQSSSSSSSIGALSEEFEHVLSTQLMSQHQDMNNSLQHDVNPDRPEISMQIHNVELALKSLSEGNIATEITTHLSELVPKIIRLERKVKTQTTLRGIFEEENQKLKTEVEQMRVELDDIKEERKTLQEEVAELKRAKEDEQLGGFDYVTKNEANEIKDAEKKEAEKQHEAEVVPPSGIREEDHFILLRKYITLKKQIEEIVKVNHSWDEHYRTMKTQLESRIDNLQKELGGVKHQAMILQKEQKVGGDMLAQEQARIEKAEKERAGAIAEVVAVNQKCEKLERYARTLTGQRNEMEKEIKRLNEALAQKMRSVGARNQSELQVEPQCAPSPASNTESPCYQQKGVDEMTEAEMKEEIELLRQQTEVFQSDFAHERHDRQRVMGELDAIQKELRRTKKVLKQREREVMYQDPELTHQLLQQDLRRDHQYSASAPPRDYGYVVYPRPQARYTQPAYPRKTGRLIAHGTGKQSYNLAANDMFIDGHDDLEIDGDQQGSVEFDPALIGTDSAHNEEQNNRICPRCERTFENDPDYHVHINACLDN